LIPNSLIAFSLVETAAKCLATQFLPSLLINQFLIVLALERVS